MSPEEISRVRRQMVDQAVKLAINGSWEEAANLNRDILALLGEQPDSYNRLGKAMAELGKPEEARAAYARSLELDPSNTIAKRNLDKLAVGAGGGGAPSQIDTRMFVEDTGKSTTTMLQAVDAEIVRDLDAGDVVELRVEGNAVNVHTLSGGYVGMLDPRLGLRLSRLIAAGNQYSAALITADGDIRVMVRETYQDPSQAGKVSFPRAAASTGVRGYTRRGLLREDDELDFGDDGDDLGDDSDETDGWSEDDDDAEPATRVTSIEPEDESFD
jgi:tetratricopeptide (TPR) repeat protein